MPRMLPLLLAGLWTVLMGVIVCLDSLCFTLVLRLSDFHPLSVFVLLALHSHSRERDGKIRDHKERAKHTEIDIHKTPPRPPTHTSSKTQKINKVNARAINLQTIMFAAQFISQAEGERTEQTEQRVYPYGQTQKQHLQAQLSSLPNALLNTARAFTTHFQRQPSD